MEFRTLYADEIECRIASISDKGLSLLLYKDARVDQNILDEQVGAMNWQRSHSRENANCTVSIWDSEKSQWISKEDTGKESYTEAEKGLASDSFKRACFNWGIGRELYTAPDIWIYADKAEIKQNSKGKLVCYDKFNVKSIEYDDKRNIKSLEIVNTKTGKIVFTMGDASEAKAEPKPKAELKTKEEPTREQILEDADNRAKVLAYANKHLDGEKRSKLCAMYKVEKLTDLSGAQCKNYIDRLKEKGINIDE